MSFPKSIVRKWRGCLLVLGGIFLLSVVGLAAWLVWFLKANEDEAGHILFKNDESLTLEKTSASGVSYKINNSSATFHLDVARVDEHCKRLFPSYAAALE